MKIVVDSNRIIAALIKDSTTRGIILDSFFDFVTPEYILIEIRKYEEDIIKKAKITKKEFEILLALISESITIIPSVEYGTFIGKLRKEIKDHKDLPYMAVFLSTNAHGIWSHDSDFLQQKRIKILTNIDMLKLSGKSNKGH